MTSQRMRRALTACGAAAAMLAGMAGPAQAETPRPPSSWTANPAHGEPPQYKCTINATAKARKAWIRYPGEPAQLGVVVTTNADIHNPYLFVGCSIKVNVQVLDTSDTVISLVSNTAVAGSWFDPWGNNKAYTWRTTADLDPEDLANIDSVEISFENVG